MSHSTIIKHKATQLRKEGFSLKEISIKLNISKSTISDWLKTITLSQKAQERLKNKQILGQYKTVLLKKQSREKKKKIMEEVAFKNLQKILLSKELYKLFCALVWWCEGNKDVTMIRFTNSDTTLVKNFLLFLRKGFNIDEAKFRALIHLHNYHDDLTQKKFWSKITNIPLKQFHKSFNKSHTGKRIHENYPGCIAISYYDAQIAKELEAIYNTFSMQGGVR